jgi:hypothetical protein
MSWRRNAFAKILIAGGMIVSTAAHAGVVVSSSGPSAKTYPVGRKLAETDRIVLQPGDNITVLDQRGTRVLRGAGSYTLAQQSGPSKSGTFAVLTRQRSAQRMRTGAVRAGDSGGPVSSPNLWYVDVSNSGTVCLPGTEDVRLWRPNAQGGAIYSIKPSGGNSSAHVSFADGEMLSPWDSAALPLKDGANFVISHAGAPESNISFKVLGTVASDAEGLAEELIENGCDAQLALLSSTLRVDEG